MQKKGNPQVHEGSLSAPVLGYSKMLSKIIPSVTQLLRSVHRVWSHVSQPSMKFRRVKAIPALIKAIIKNCAAPLKMVAAISRIAGLLIIKAMLGSFLFAGLCTILNGNDFATLLLRNVIVYVLVSC